MNENVLNLNNFKDKINNTDKIVLIDFYADWCGPCKMLAPVIKEISEKYKDKIKVCKVNVDNNQELAVKYNITNIPTLLFFKNGSLVNSSIGFVSKSELEEIINNFK